MNWWEMYFFGWPSFEQSMWTEESVLFQGQSFYENMIQQKTVTLSILLWLKMLLMQLDKLAEWNQTMGLKVHLFLVII